MKAKTSRKGLKVVISLVIAFAMIGGLGLPGQIFADEIGSGDGGDGATAVIYGESGTPPYDPATYGRNEDNRYKGTNATDPYSVDRPQGRIPPDVDVTYLNTPDPSVPHDSAEKDVVATVTNWDDEPHEARISLQVYKELEFDPFVVWTDNMESCYTNWTANDLDGDGNTWGRTEVRSASPTHSYHNVKDCVGGTYVGSSQDELVSKSIDIPTTCANGKPAFLWLDFNQWIQGEISENQGKFEDYGNVYVQFDGGGWELLASYEGSDGAWVTTDPENSENLMYATYDYDADGNPIGIRLPYDPAVHDNLEIKFEWISDPAINNEGWYIDDVSLKAMCGPIQELVWQEYKPVDHSLDLDAFYVDPDLQAPFTTPYQKMVQFHLPFDPLDDTTYFFEVYSELIDAEDVDGHYDYNGSWMTDVMIGATNPEREYWNPDNGVNESIYFGIWHDGQADYVNWDPSVQPEAEMTDECVDMPIAGQVSNQGTVAEEIPYTIEVRETVVEFLMDDNLESGDGNWVYQNFGTVCSGQWGLTEMASYSPTHSMYMGTETCPEDGQGNYPGNVDGDCVGTPVWDISDYLAANIPISGEWFHRYSIVPDGDQIMMGVVNPVDHLWLRFSGTATDGVQDSWARSGIADWFGPYGATTLNDVYHNANDWFVSNGYSDMGGEIQLFFWFESTPTGNIPAGMDWSGYMFDDFKLATAGTGETVWSTDGVTDTLLPGEAAEVEAVWEACQYSDYTPTLTTHVEDDWNTPFANDPDLAYMYNDFASGDNTYIHTQVSEQDFEDGVMPQNFDTHDNTFGTPGSWESAWNEKTGWQEDHYAWTGEGTDDPWDSSYGPVMDDCLVPKDENGDIMTFDLTEETAVDFEFDLWNEIETYFDYLTLEISNDSGVNWWTIGAWNNLTNPAANEEVWQHIALELFNGTAYISAFDDYDPILGVLNWVNVGITDEMTFRFHVLSDIAWQFKGAYIDDIEMVSHVNETIPYNGHDQNWMWTHDVLFEEDFEDGLDDWLNVKQWTGSMWHVTDTCSYSGDHSAANFDHYSYSSYNKHLYTGIYGGSAIGYDHNYMSYRNNADDKLISTIDLSSVYQAYLQFMVNYNVADNDVLLLEGSTDGETWSEITRYTGDSGGWEGQTTANTFPLSYNYGIDVTDYAGAKAYFRFHLMSNETGVGQIQVDDITVVGKMDTEPPVTTAVLGPATPDGDNGWYVSDVTVTLNAQDREMGTTYFRIDGGSWQTYSGPFQVSDDGEHTVEYYSVDAVGNEEAPKTVEFKIDQTNPTANLETPETGRIYLFGRDLMPRILFKDKALIIGPLTATASASDETSGVNYVTFETSAGSFEDAVSPYEYELPFGFGSDTLTISVKDNAGNANNNVASVAYMKIL